ncbi:MAG: single-stranded DNA-binding protein [Bacilli bacterium]
MNYSMVIGRFVEDPEVTTIDGSKEVCNVTLAVPRSFKNEKGEYETDFIRCQLWSGLAKNTAEYCKKGDLVGIKGRLQTGSYEADDGTKKYTSEIVVERISFLSSKEKSKEKSQDQDIDNDLC